MTDIHPKPDKQTTHEFKKNHNLSLLDKAKQFSTIYVFVHRRMVEQTSVHEVLKNSGPWFKVPPDVCRLIHVRVALRGSLKLEELNVDKRLWTFSAKLIPNVDKQLKKVGLLTSEGGELTDGGDKRSDGQVEQV